MASIKNLDGMTGEELNRELEQGGRFVVYEYTVSILVMTFKRGSDVYFLRSGETGFGSGLPFTLITLLFGWWGIPWGPIYSVMSLFTNFRGGRNVTAEVVNALNARA